MSKVGAVMGREGDATPFTEVTVDNISTTLHRRAALASHHLAQACLLTLVEVEQIQSWAAPLSLPFRQTVWELIWPSFLLFGMVS